MRAALLIGVTLLLVPAVTVADSPKKKLPLDGEVFELSGRTAFLIPAGGVRHRQRQVMISLGKFSSGLA